ncbi:hypothetical protein L226DRAFT_531396 [Lentinus tigrinus ALCF2SS1-7]|uniref:uncharacterized protein n=1 Tax=Lentinus tigrinus ALCF2SS1-7 TaxID=1328758 RepID=UPI001166127D|nr:hypothetical protein L226DRAFT_531396 [Lentinus tigrinus ALCF2SS1-7]
MWTPKSTVTAPLTTLFGSPCAIMMAMLAAATRNSQSNHLSCPRRIRSAAAP